MNEGPCPVNICIQNKGVSDHYDFAFGFSSFLWLEGMKATLAPCGQKSIKKSKTVSDPPSHQFKRNFGQLHDHHHCKNAYSREDF
jgi:hypothetical protein